MTPFARDIVAVLRGLEAGQVLTYGEVAAQAGRPAGARGVGQVLRRHSRDGDLPWWRVVDVRGRLVPGLEAEQRRLLEAEGVICSGGRVAALPGADRARTWNGGGVARR